MWKMDSVQVKKLGTAPETVMAGIPFDVYNLKGQLVRRQTTSTQGLSAGYYVINQRVVFIPGKI